MSNRALTGLAAALAVAAAFFLSIDPGRAAECPAADVSRYEELPSPKALVGNDLGCTTWQGGLTSVEGVINAALGVCLNKTGVPCHLIKFAGSGAEAPAAPLPAPPPAPVPQEVNTSPADPCPGGDRVPAQLGAEPVRINPNGLCAFTLWYRHCIFLRQAGEDKTLGPYCPPEAKLIAGAVRAKQFPPDVEWVWSAEQPFTAFLLLFREGAGQNNQVAQPAGQLAVGSPEWKQRCATKYKSFDWNTGLFMGKDGNRHECRLP